MSEYVEHVRQLESSLGPGEKALQKAVGGEFEAVGKLEYYLLRSLGLNDNDLVVDIGCGSGRLSCRLSPFPASATSAPTSSRGSSKPRGP